MPNDKKQTIMTDWQFLSLVYAMNGRKTAKALKKHLLPAELLKVLFYFLDLEMQLKIINIKSENISAQINKSARNAAGNIFSSKVYT